MTPMMKQYHDIKSQYQDCILFYRMGDFYELFEEDAIVSSKILGLTLTRRNHGGSGETPLCGFPYHAAERYIPKMIHAGHKVAICEQVEDPKAAVGIVKREVIEVITAGTTLHESTLDSRSSHYLCSILKASDHLYAISSLELSTGRFMVAEGSYEEVVNELYRLSPREVLTIDQEKLPAFLVDLKSSEQCTITSLNPGFFDPAHSHQLLCEQLKVSTLETFGIAEDSAAVSASGAVLNYALDLKKTQLDHLDRIEFYQLGDYMSLDPATVRNLELIKAIHSDDEDSTLFRVMDYTVTAMGARKLKHWISHPLINIHSIMERQNCVAELYSQPALMEELRKSLREIADIERLIGRIGSGRANARDLVVLAKSLNMAQQSCRTLGELNSPLFHTIRDQLLHLDEKANEILNLFVDHPPLLVREGKMIAPGGSQELDALNEGIRDAREWIANLEKTERERLGISTLKVGFNRVFGYYLEVTKQHSEKIPPEYIRKQTLSNGERYITPEMKDYETRILTAESQINELEYRIFEQMREKVNTWRGELKNAADHIAGIDALTALGYGARKLDYHRPELVEENILEITAGSHPVISKNNPQMNFITNDIMMSSKQRQIMLITGPNMAGKSTYLRQTALIVLMAQIGSFVPATSAKIGITDRIFTRVGASDRLSRGQSTFMVEMIETANILHNATPRSLILLDEIGRGTSTFDGLSLAWAIVETLHNDSRKAGKTLFATHYHELTSLADNLERVENFHVSVKEKEGELLFLHKILPGGCDSSYGIQVAAMAGLPEEVILRAKKILLRLEKNRTIPADEIFEVPRKIQQDLFAPDPISEDEQLALNEIKSINPDEMTPIQALQFLAKLKQNYLR